MQDKRAEQAEREAKIINGHRDLVCAIVYQAALDAKSDPEARDWLRSEAADWLELAGIGNDVPTEALRAGLASFAGRIVEIPRKGAKPKAKRPGASGDEINIRQPASRLVNQV